MATVRFTESEAETTILALEYFRRFHLHEYTEEDVRKEIIADLSSATRKLREAP